MTDQQIQERAQLIWNNARAALGFKPSKLPEGRSDFLEIAKQSLLFEEKEGFRDE